MNRKRLLDLLIISIWSFSTVATGFLLPIDNFFSKAFVLGFISTIPPVIYMSSRKKKNWKRIALGTLVFGLLLGHLLEFVAHKSFIWQCKSLVFNSLIFGTSTYDCTLGHGLMVIFMLTFYEHFLNKDVQHYIPKKVLIVLIPSLLIGMLLYFVPEYGVEIPVTSYPYFYIGILAIIPLIFLSLKNHKIITKLLFMGVFFFAYYFFFELLAVYKSYWIYPGNNYIGWVEILNLKFPFEELFFWMMLYAATIVSYYEIFIDDEK